MNEDKFIINAARLNLSEKNISILKEFSSHGIDWDTLEDMASAHGVSTFIYYSLQHNGLLELLPNKMRNNFKKEFYSVAIKNSIMLDGLSKLTKITTNKIILLKGIDLIQSLYPNIAIRAMTDIDILIEKDYALDTWKNLLQNNLEWHSSGKSRLHEKISPETDGHLPPIVTKRFVVEIHCNIFGGRRLYETSKQVWVKADLHKYNIFRMSNEFMLIHLCSHFYTHLQTLAILRMLCDINEFITKYKNTIDWVEIEKICHDPDLKNEVDTALTYSLVLLDTPIPNSFVSEEIINNSHVTISSLLYGNTNSKKSSRKTFFSSLKYFTNPIERIIFLYRTIIPVKAWLSIKYDITTKRKLYKTYLIFWHYLFNKHILKKSGKKFI